MAYPLTSPIEVEGTGGAPGQINLSDGTNQVTLRAPTGLAGNVDFTLPSTDGVVGQVLQRSGATSTAWVTSSSNAQSSLPISLQFNGSNGSPFDTSSTTFVVVSRIIYRGTTIDNTIGGILVIAGTSNANATGQVQVFDATNSNIIATSAIFGPDLPLTIIDLGTISNLPTTQAIFEIQVRRVNTSGGGAAILNSIQIYG